MLVDDVAASSSAAALRTDEIVLDDDKTAREYKLDSAEGCCLGLCFADTTVVSLPSPDRSDFCGLGFKPITYSRCMYCVQEAGWERVDIHNYKDFQASQSAGEQ